MKNSNESAADSLKRAMSGLVKRPGMRGATFSASNDTTVVSFSLIYGPKVPVFA